MSTPGTAPSVDAFRLRWLNMEASLVANAFLEIGRQAMHLLRLRAALLQRERQRHARGAVQRGGLLAVGEPETLRVGAHDLSQRIHGVAQAQAFSSNAHAQTRASAGQQVRQHVDTGQRASQHGVRARARSACTRGPMYARVRIRARFSPLFGFGLSAPSLSK